MRKEIILTVLIGLFIAVAAVSAQASLVPMSWGFPTFEATNTLTQTADSLATASDVESADIAFPTTGSAFGTAFPTITQTADKNELLSSFQCLDQRQSQRFSYPFVSIGYSAIPSMGFL